MRPSFAKATAQRRATGLLRKAKFALLVDAGWTPAAAGREIGVGQQRSSQIWAEIRADRGEEPVAAAQQRLLEQHKDEVAERVSLGQSVVDAGRAIGINEKRTFKVWAKIRADLGPQAV